MEVGKRAALLSSSRQIQLCGRWEHSAATPQHAPELGSVAQDPGAAEDPKGNRTRVLGRAAVGHVDAEEEAVLVADEDVAVQLELRARVRLIGGVNHIRPWRGRLGCAESIRADRRGSKPHTAEDCDPVAGCSCRHRAVCGVDHSARCGVLHTEEITKRAELNERRLLIGMLQEQPPSAPGKGLKRIRDRIFRNAPGQQLLLRRVRQRASLQLLNSRYFRKL